MGSEIISILKEKRIFYPSEEFRKKANIKSINIYKRMYNESIDSPKKFWGKLARDLYWYRKWDETFHWDSKNLECRWFKGGKINASYNCLDRHVRTWRKNKAALIWEGEDGSTRTYTYQELFREVCRFANVLKSKGIKKGDRVCIYMSMVPELVIAMLACTRIGAIHSIVFGGFSAESLMDRINDCGAKLLITVDAGIRKGKIIPLKANADSILNKCPTIQSVIVCKRTNINIKMNKRDSYFDEELSNPDIGEYCKPVKMDAEDPLFILYTSGTTGKPKGVLHTTGGYLLYALKTCEWVFDLKEEDTYWCTADIGWITGHSYIVYGPLAKGVTTLMFEGTPTYPRPDRYWQVVEKYNVNIFYTAPTVIRALMREGAEWVKKHDLSSLRLLGSVGEPINPEAWLWYYKVIGKEMCPIVDTWWQTETGGILISPIPGITPLKPGSATHPLPGVKPAVLREDGTKAKRNEGGYLVITQPWPSMLRTIWRNKKRFKDTYFSKFPGIYLSGDSAKIDEDGYFWVLGRLDDVVNVSGHRIGTAEVESALVSHHCVAEAAIVPFPHRIKGQGLYAFVILKKDVKKTDKLKVILREHVAKKIGPIAKPDKIQFVDGLPKTRSGKIMRRILKAIALGSKDFGNISTLANPEVVELLFRERVK